MFSNQSFIKLNIWVIKVHETSWSEWEDWKYHSNYSVGSITVKFHADICQLQSMNPVISGDPLTSLLAPPAGQSDQFISVIFQLPFDPLAGDSVQTLIDPWGVIML